MMSARDDVAMMMSEMVSTGNPVACEARGSSHQNFGRHVRVRGRSDVDVSSGVK